MQPLLEGRVEPDEVSKLRRELKGLEAELVETRADLLKAQKQSAAGTRALTVLRRQLEPLHQALAAVFGELDAAGIGSADHSPAGAIPAHHSAIWESWKSRLGQTAAKIIDALLLHREMNTQQLAIACGLHRTTIPAGIYALNKAGLINKSGGRFSLKEM